MLTFQLQSSYAIPHVAIRTAHGYEHSSVGHATPDTQVRDPAMVDRDFGALSAGDILFTATTRRAKAKSRDPRNAHPGLIALSLGLVVGDILLSAYAQQLAASRYGDFKKVLRRELAGMFLNHFLPYSVGIVTLVEEYYRKITNDRTYAYFVAIMPVLANFILSFIVLVLISPFTLLYISHQMSGHTPTWVTLALLAGGLGLVVLTVVYWQRIKSMIQLVLHTMRRTRPRTVTAVLAVVALQVGINSATLWLIALSVGVAVPVMTALALILASNFTGNAAPTPGGIAVAEATLVIGMTSAGLTLPDAVAITLLYRFVTFWLELIPGGWAMATIQLRSSHHDY